MIELWVVWTPVLTACILLLLKERSKMEWIHIAGSLATTAFSLRTVWDVLIHGAIESPGGFFYVDSLSGVVLVSIAIVGFTAALHSISYIRKEIQEGSLQYNQIKRYYVLFHLFIATMVLVCMVNNMGMLWVAIEATTIVSAFLVAIYRKGEAIEAAWKYLMVCSAGIAIALLGVILVYASSVRSLGSANEVLNWTLLHSATNHLDARFMVLAFVCIMIGFGTKVGLAPMHSWLPDAHSQAPAPISAVLSGVLLNCAMLGLIRFGIVTSHAVGAAFVQHLFIGFGIISIFIAIPFIIVQQDFKRMLAFSTVEHMGIIAVAIGIGGKIGWTAALIQMFHHSMAKSMLFLASGNIAQKYHTKHIARVSGIMKVMPYTGVVFLIGGLAITGVPPMSIFTSEFGIITAGFAQGHAVLASTLVLFVAIIFGAMMFHMAKMAFGEKRERMDIGEVGRLSTVSLFIPLAFVLLLGLYMPETGQQLFQQAMLVIEGSGK
ncbi:hydrogenase 4 subunit F [Fodinisporobacter ferrooxydans]|uniref:Hydrogenase 4 subunit F n=1 Tax=Fodinisporobacter ferrooxydans TaxID=2901836 RepID=A0ABY4CGL0_9BACL|nr:hydrogenase 4 subunit F [Alicyclobacillaceae bacterium MYW30-H2]